MEPLLVFAALVGFAIASFLWGVDSRPGFADGRVDRVERWFPHERRAWIAVTRLRPPAAISGATVVLMACGVGHPAPEIGSGGETDGPAVHIPPYRVFQLMVI